MPSMGLRLLSLIPLSNLINHVPGTVISVLALPMICTRYVPGMYLIELFFPRARLVCCFPCVYLF